MLHHQKILWLRQSISSVVVVVWRSHVQSFDHSYVLPLGRLVALLNFALRLLFFCFHALSDSVFPCFCLPPFPHPFPLAIVACRNSTDPPSLFISIIASVVVSFSSAVLFVADSRLRSVLACSRFRRAFPSSTLSHSGLLSVAIRHFPGAVGSSSFALTASEPSLHLFFGWPNLHAPLARCHEPAV